MKIRHDKKSCVPWRLGNLKRWKVVMASNVRVSPRARIHLKVLVFETAVAMREMFQKMGGDPGRNSGGCVLYCSRDHNDFRDGKETATRYVDPRFFAVMGLVAGRIDLDTLTHECVHAAEAYADRFPHLKWPNQRVSPFEKYCYPAGILTQYLCGVLAEYMKAPPGFQHINPPNGKKGK
jgi:hypothetical protein